MPHSPCQDAASSWSARTSSQDEVWQPPGRLGHQRGSWEVGGGDEEGRRDGRMDDTYMHVHVQLTLRLSNPVYQGRDAICLV